MSFSISHKGSREYPKFVVDESGVASGFGHHFAIRADRGRGGVTTRLAGMKPALVLLGDGAGIFLPLGGLPIQKFQIKGVLGAR